MLHHQPRNAPIEELNLRYRVIGPQLSILNRWFSAPRTSKREAWGRHLVEFKLGYQLKQILKIAPKRICPKPKHLNPIPSYITKSLLQDTAITAQLLHEAYKFRNAIT